MFICISSINNKRSLLRFQSTTAPTNRGWSACAHTKSLIFSTVACNATPARHLCYVNYITTFSRKVSLGRLSTRTAKAVLFCSYSVVFCLKEHITSFAMCKDLVCECSRLSSLFAARAGIFGRETFLRKVPSGEER